MILETEILYVHLFDTSLLFLQLEFWLALFRRLCGLCNQFPIYVITCMYCTVVVVIVLQHFLQKTLPRLPFVHPPLRRPRRVHLLDDHYQYPRAPNFPPPWIGR